jgi:hypothetical protein
VGAGHVAACARAAAPAPAAAQRHRRAGRLGRAAPLFLPSAGRKTPATCSLGRACLVVTDACMLPLCL